MEFILSFSKQKLITGLSVLFAFVLAWGIYLQFLEEKAGDINYLYNVAYSLLFFYGGVVALYGALSLRLRGNFGRAQLGFAIAFITQAVALWMWTYYNLILGVEIPYPSWADLFFLIFVPTAGMATWYLMKIYQWEIKSRLVLESVVMLGIFSYVILAYVNIPDLSEGLSMLEKAMNVIYPLSDAIIFAMVYLVLRASGGRVQQGIILFLSGLAVHSIGDFIFSYRTAAGTYWNGDVSDIALTIAGFLMSMGFIYIVASFKNSYEEGVAQTGFAPR